MKKLFLHGIPLSALIAALALTACDSESIKPDAEGKDPTEIPQNKPQNEDLPQEEDIYNLPTTRLQPIKLGQDAQKIAGLMNRFSWKLFAKTFSDREQAGNLLLSPYSLLQNLLMLNNGLEGNTLQEILGTLGTTEYDKNQMNNYVMQLNEGLKKVDLRTQYRTDNSIWYDNKLTLMPLFAKALKEYFNAETYPAAMNKQTLDSINGWARTKTFGRIPEILAYINPGSQSVLMNTVYFRGKWSWAPSKKDIKDGVFYSEDGKEEKAKMVAFHRPSAYWEDNTYQATSRTFGNRAYAMDFILPQEGVNASEALTHYLENLGSKAETALVKLDFPCFETAQSMNASELLQKMGIQQVFLTSRPEDFHLFNVPSFVSGMIQKTSITVDEVGAEAAAATATIPKLDSGEEGKKIREVEMKLNRPFFYAIRETSTGTPLFIGYQGSVK